MGVVLSGGQPRRHNVIAAFTTASRAFPTPTCSRSLANCPPERKYITIDVKQDGRLPQRGGFDTIQSGARNSRLKNSSRSASRFQTNSNSTRSHHRRRRFQHERRRARRILSRKRAFPPVVCGCPKTIDGDLKNEFTRDLLLASTTAVKTYRNLSGNIMRDANSAQKYWHPIKLDGPLRESHIALEAVTSGRRTRTCAPHLREEANRKDSMKPAQAIKPGRRRGRSSPRRAGRARTSRVPHPRPTSSPFRTCGALISNLPASPPITKAKPKASTPRCQGHESDLRLASRRSRRRVPR